MLPKPNKWTVWMSSWCSSCGGKYYTCSVGSFSFQPPIQWRLTLVHTDGISYVNQIALNHMTREITLVPVAPVHINAVQLRSTFGKGTCVSLVQCIAIMWPIDFSGYSFKSFVCSIVIQSSSLSYPAQKLQLYPNCAKITSKLHQNHRKSHCNYWSIFCWPALLEKMLDQDCRL